MKRQLALFGAAVVGVLAWPGPSHADTSLGGYSGIAQAEPIRIQIYEPTIPIPATPQIDGGIAFTRSSTDTGPVTRALASYLWPGDTVGDGFGALTGKDSSKYPVQVNSRYPATPDSPATNKGQISDGNGMATHTDGATTTASVTGLGVSGTNAVSNVGQGLPTILGAKPSASSAPPPAVPVPTSDKFASLVSAGNVTSQSSITVASHTITSTAHAAVSDVKLLAGLVTIGGITTTSTTVSDGAKATTTGTTKLTDVVIGGKDLGLTDAGIALGGKNVPAPKVSDSANPVLQKLGISVSPFVSTRTVQGATGSLAATGLVITVDTVTLKTLLNVGALTGPLQDLVGKIPNLGSQLQPLLGLGPKIVFLIGDASSSATASPQFSGGSTGGGSTGGGTAGGGTTGGTGSGTGSLGSGSLGTTGTTGTGTTTTPAASAPAGSTTTPYQATGYHLPGLGAIPKFLILAGLVLAIGVGYALRTAGGLLLGGLGSCPYGLPSGVPDLRE